VWSGTSGIASLHPLTSLCYNLTGKKRETEADGTNLMNKRKPPPSVWESLGQLGALGFTVAIPLALGYYLGVYLDGVTHQQSLFLLFGLLLGLIVGIYGAYRLFKRFL
jgi:predicted F0F1-ATPase subunit